MSVPGASSVSVLSAGASMGLLCRMFNHAIAKKPLPKYHSTDNDPSFRFHRWRANLKVLHIAMSLWVSGRNTE